MRPCLFAAAFAALLAAPAAFADDDAKDGKPSCHIQLEKDDVLVERNDLVLQPGQKVHDAIAMQGSVVVKKGAEVHDVVALQGSVTVEAGAIVRGDVVSLGGKLQLEDGAEVKGDVVSLGGKLERASSVKVAGDQVNFSGLQVNGTDLVGSLLGKVLGEMKNCRVSFDDAGPKAR